MENNTKNDGGIMWSSTSTNGTYVSYNDYIKNIDSNSIINGSGNVIAFGGTGSSSISLGTCTGTSVSILCNSYLKETKVYDDRIELFYLEEPMIYPSTKKIYKIIYSCVDGKWNVSEKIYGKIIPYTPETYEF